MKNGFIYILFHLRYRLIPVGGILCGRFHDDIAQSGRNTRINFHRRRNCTRYMLKCDLYGIIPVIRSSADQHFIEHYSGRIYIALFFDLLAVRLLG